MSDLRKAMQGALDAAQAVIERWESPLWRDSVPTATFIHRLRDALPALRDALGAQGDWQASGAGQAAPPTEMCLCEARSLVLRVGRAYIFRPMAGCASCDAAFREAVAAYGPDGGES